jgi:DNA-directed RNA polymerase subunit M/transcription elongation factor TFIIS
MSVKIEFSISSKVRQKCIDLLREELEEIKLKKRHIETIEDGIYSYTKQYCNNNKRYVSQATAIYKDICKDIIFNKGNKTMKKLFKDIKADDYNSYNLAYLKPEEKDNDVWEKIKTKRENTAKRLKELPTIKWKKCRFCNGTQYSWYQMQTRSADEPVTIFYICKGCDHCYKVNN